MNNPVLFAIVENVPRVMAVVALLINVLGFYLITTESPKSMGSYIHVLLGMQMMSFWFDLSYSLLVGPMPLPGAIGMQMTGLLARTFPTEGNIFGFFAPYSLMLMAMFVVFAFGYREFIVTHTDETGKQKQIRYAQVVMSIIYMVSIIPSYMISTTSDAEARRYMKQLDEQLYDGAALCLMHPAKLDKMYILCSVSLLLVPMMIVYIHRSVSRIDRTLSGKRVHMSLSSIRLQKMLMRAVIWQGQHRMFSLKSIIPFLLLATPAVIMGIVICILPAVEHMNSSSLQPDMTAISMTIPALYSPAHVISMIYFTSPFRDFCIEKLGLSENVIRVEQHSSQQQNT